MKAALILFIKAYRLLLSPMLGNQCRFTPTCSLYGLQALQRHGAIGGSYLTVKRLCRCHPFGDGGIDEVPALPPAFVDLISRARKRQKNV